MFFSRTYFNFRGIGRAPWYNFFSLLAIFSALGMGCGDGGGDGRTSGGSSGAGGSSDLSGVILLSWNSNAENDLAGYRIYYGTSSGVYDHEIDAGMATKSGFFTMHSLTGLSKGQVYCLVVTAYDRSNQESGFSNEACGTAQ